MGKEREPRPNYALRRLALIAGLGVIAALAIIKPWAGSDEKIKLPSGNTIEKIDRHNHTVEIDTQAADSAPIYPGDERDFKAGDPITVVCNDFSPSSRPLELYETLSELALSQPSDTPAQRWEPAISVEAVADTIAAYNGITNGDGDISPSFAQPDTVYQVPQFCYIEN